MWRFLSRAGAALVLSTGFASAELWSSFYTSSAPPKPKLPVSVPVQPAIDDHSVCLAEILKAQARYGIPDNVLLAIGIQEAGRSTRKGLTVWPWAVNAEGEGAFFTSKAAMVSWVRAKQASGVQSIDVGCMQINQKWHKKGFVSLEHAADPAINVDYAARYLRSLYQEEGNWWQAAGRYHSSTQKYKDIYLSSLARNQQVANAKAGQFQARIGKITLAAAPAPTPAPEPRMPTPEIFWGAEGDNPASDTQSGSFSIYSNHPIRPVLPEYRELF